MAAELSVWSRPTTAMALAMALWLPLLCGDHCHEFDDVAAADSPRATFEVMCPEPNATWIGTTPMELDVNMTSERSELEVDCCLGLCDQDRSLAFLLWDDGFGASIIACVMDEFFFMDFA